MNDRLCFLPLIPRGGQALHSLLVAIGVLLAVLTAPAFGLDGFRASRPIDVDAPGWVAVDLDGDVLVHAPDDLLLVGPAGTEVPFRWLSDESERRPARVLRVAESAEGWAVDLDLGAGPPRHERLVFEVEQKTSAPGCRLETSADGASWTLLTVADLFALGESGDLRRMALDYPSSATRYLRLHWPRAAGLPELRRVEVAELAAATSLELASFEPGNLDGGRLYEIPLPRPLDLVVRVELAIAGSGATAWRLRAADGRWRVLGEGVARGEDVRLRLPIELPADAEPVLVLELYGAGELRQASATRRSRRLIFEAAKAGRYVLAYGSAARRAGHPAKTGVPARLARVELGPEEIGDWPPLPVTVAGAGGVMPEGPFASGWRIEPGDAVSPPRTLVRLELDDDVRAASRSDLDDLRLDAGGRQVPYIRVRLPRPRQVHRGLLTGEDEGTVSRYQLPMPANAALTELVLTTGTRPFERRVTGRYRLAVRPGVDERFASAFASTTWRCFDRAPLPCALRLQVRSPASETLQVEIANGDNSPLGSLTVELWARRDALVFVWPEEDVMLRAGADVAAPRYDLVELAGLLARRDMTELKLGERIAASVEPALPSWALPAAIGLAAAGLLMVLVRMMRGHS